MNITDEMIEAGVAAAGSLTGVYCTFSEVRHILTAALSLAPQVKETAPPQAHLRAIADAARAYVDSVNGEPEKDCWDTEDGKEAPGAHRFASDWAWQEYDVKKQKAFDALRAALATTEGK